MAFTQTTLAAPCGPSDLRLTLASSAGFLPGQAIRIDSETMYCTQVLTPTVVAVRMRGADGSIGLAHDLGANVEISGAAGDYGAPAVGEATQIPTYAPPVITLGSAAPTLAVPSEDTIYVFNGAAAINATLPAPTKAQDGLRLTFTANTLFAHKVTATGLINGGATGNQGVNTVSCTAFKGASFVLMACQGFWNVLSLNGATAP